MSEPTNNSSSATLGRSVPMIRFQPSSVGDCVPDTVMREIAKRMLISIDDTRSGAVRSETAPTDTSRLWFKPSSSELYSFDRESAVWVLVNPDGVYTCISVRPRNFIRRDDSGCLYALISPSELNLLTLDEFGDPILDKEDVIPCQNQDKSITSSGSGAATLSVTFNDFKDAEAAVNVIFKSDPGAGARWWVTSQTGTTVELSFAGLASSTDYNLKVAVHRTKY